jgi:hypothetical protein
VPLFSLITPYFACCGLPVASFVLPFSHCRVFLVHPVPGQTNLKASHIWGLLFSLPLTCFVALPCHPLLLPADVAKQATCRPSCGQGVYFFLFRALSETATNGLYRPVCSNADRYACETSNLRTGAGCGPEHIAEGGSCTSISLAPLQTPKKTKACSKPQSGYLTYLSFL